MANRSKAKGTSHETSIVRYLKENGWPHADRLTLSGNQDRGDVRLGDGIGVVIEAKAEKTYQIPAWLREAEVERDNAKADLGVVWFKLNGHARAEDGAVVMTPATFLDLLFQAGYGGQSR